MKFEQIEEQVRDWSKTKEIFSLPPKAVPLEAMSANDAGRLSIDVDNTRFECCLFSSSAAKKLHVLLSSSPTRAFVKKSWTKFLDGFVLYVDDATKIAAQEQRGPHHGVYYFYGDKDSSHHILISRLIKKIAQIHGITDIFITGNSNAGFAALSIANIIEGANAIAFNPQFSIPLHFAYYDHEVPFEDFLGIDLSEDNERYEVYDIIKNTKSKFFIYTNIASEIDAVQCISFFKRIGRKASSGFFRINNIFYYISNIPYKSPHDAVPYEACMSIVENILIKEKNDMYIYQFNALMTELKRHYNENTALQNDNSILLNKLEDSKYKIALFKSYANLNVRQDISRCLSLANIDGDMKKFFLNPAPAILFGTGDHAKLFYHFCKIFLKECACFCVSEKDFHQAGGGCLPCHTLETISGLVDLPGHDIFVCEDDLRTDEAKSLLSGYPFKSVCTVESWEKTFSALRKAKKIFLSLFLAAEG